MFVLARNMNDNSKNASFDLFLTVLIFIGKKNDSFEKFLDSLFVNFLKTFVLLFKNIPNSCDN